PASVGMSARLERLNSLVCKCASSSETFRLTVVSGAFCRRAAADRLPASATASTTDMASRRSIEVSIFWQETFQFCQISLVLGRVYGFGVSSRAQCRSFQRTRPCQTIREKSVSDNPHYLGA